MHSTFRQHNQLFRIVFRLVLALSDFRPYTTILFENFGGFCGQVSFDLFLPNFYPNTLHSKFGQFFLNLWSDWSLPCLLKFHQNTMLLDPN